MATKIAPCFKDKASEANKGNLSVDTMVYTIAAGDALGDVVLLRRMGEFNKYVRLRVIASAAMAAAATISVGYVSREDGGTDDPDFFGLNLDVNGTTDHALVTVPLEVSEKHDLAITLDTDPSADAGKSYTVIAEFVCEAG